MELFGAIFVVDLVAHSLVYVACLKFTVCEWSSEFSVTNFCPIFGKFDQIWWYISDDISIQGFRKIRV